MRLIWGLWILAHIDIPNASVNPHSWVSACNGPWRCLLAPLPNMEVQLTSFHLLNLGHPQNCTVYEVYSKEPASKTWIGVNMSPKRRFIPWAMKMDHGRWYFSIVRLHGPTSMVLKNSIYKVFGPLTRSKLIVHQKERPCTTKWICWYLFPIYVQVGEFWKKKSSLTTLFSSLFLSSSSLPQKKVH